MSIILLNLRAHGIINRDEQKEGISPPCLHILKSLSPSLLYRDAAIKERGGIIAAWKFNFYSHPHFLPSTRNLPERMINFIMMAISFKFWAIGKLHSTHQKSFLSLLCLLRPALKIYLLSSATFTDRYCVLFLRVLRRSFREKFFPPFVQEEKKRPGLGVLESSDGKFIRDFNSSTNTTNTETAP